MTGLIVKEMTVTAGNAPLVQGASFTLSPGELVVLLGPNGAGKTSLLRGALGLTPRDAGTALIDGDNTASLAPQARARKISYLPQARALAWPICVKDVVALGRFAHGASISRLNETDKAAIDAALSACELQSLAHRRTDTLSGGELTRVHFARALAAQTPFLVADEPIAALDPRHQFAIMDILAAYVQQGNSVLVVLHDISLAVRYASRLIWMQSGHIIADGRVEETLTAERLSSVYGIRSEIHGRDVRLIGPDDALLE